MDSEKKMYEWGSVNQNLKVVTKKWPSKRRVHSSEWYAKYLRGKGVLVIGDSNSKN